MSKTSSGADTRGARDLHAVPAGTARGRCQEHNSLDLLAIVPTRNRPELAARAAMSLHAAGVQRIVISDNTSDISLRKKLDGAMGDLPPNVNVIHPPRDLQMAIHWEWALEQARALHPSAQYVTYFTDRRRIIPGRFAVVRWLCQRWPGEIVSFLEDGIDDLATPVFYHPAAASGRVFAVSAHRLLDLASRSKFTDALPLMRNCIVPMTVIDRLQEQFDNIFGNAAPDYRFAFHALAVEERVIFFDGAVYGHDHRERSNGASQGRGVTSGDAADFSKLTKAFNEWAPTPELLTLTNAVLNEYCAVRAETTGELSAIDDQSYARANVIDVARFEDAGVRRQQQGILEGLDPITSTVVSQMPPSSPVRRWARRTAVRLAETHLGTWTCQRAHARGAWVPPSGWMRFPSGTAALEYVSKHPFRPARNGWHLADWAGEGVTRLASDAEVTASTTMTDAPG